MDQSSSRGWQRASIYDAARRAGVSHQTVSRVVNDHPEVRDSTRARVSKAIEESNYAPNLVARALATRHVRRIGVLVDGSAHDGPNLTLRALERAAREAGYGLSAFSVDEESQQLDLAVTDLIDEGIEALCVVAPRDSLLDPLRRRALDLPTVVIQVRAESVWRSVGIDQREGARLAVRHLVGLGHRTIAHVAGPMDWTDARERRGGWQDCLAEAALREGPLVLGGWTSDYGFEFGRSVDAGETTAVFAGNDRIALGVVHGLRSRGIRVPDDVSVVGFDDLSDTHHFLPPLTTVRQNFTELGRLALESVVAALDGYVEPSRSIISPTLVVRESTAAPGGALPV